MKGVETTAKRIADLAAKMLVADIVALSKDLENSNLVKSIQSEIKVSGADAFIRVLANDYYKFIDSGRRAGATPPPYAAILDWIKRKKIGGGDISPNKLAWAIRAAIAKNGIRPRPYLKAYQKNLEAELQKVFAKEFETTIINNFKLPKK